jgi:hypothetical protein
MAFENIYLPLLEAAVLTDEHRRELIDKRGLSQETIKKAKLGSGGPHLAAMEEGFLKLVASGHFREQDLVASGVFIHDGKRARLNPVLLREKNSIDNKEFSNVLIPYLNEKEEPYLIRPHKLGFKDIPSEIYHELNLRDKPAEVILTEGEFKAIAGVQYGFPTIAVPGISSFAENKFKVLVKMLKDYQVQRIVIMFDNETKDDPNIEGRYKANPNNRYDTQFYAYYMASKLEKDGGFAVVIATLPDGWKDETGKIDIDGCAAQLKTTGEMKKIVYDAVSRNEFMKDLSTEAKQVVLRKNQQKYHRSKIQKHFNRYVVMKNTKAGPIPVDISNFVMRVIATHDTPDGVKREVEFTNEFGRRSNSFTIPSDAMSSGDAFRNFALSKGDFVWRGSTDELLTIWESEFLTMDEGRYIIESDHIGWVEREKIWMFGNVAIRQDGTEIHADQNNIFWLEKRGIKPISLNISGGKNGDYSGVPHMHTGAFDVTEFRTRMAESIGINETNVLLGWISAVPFMEEIFMTYRSFPFLFVTGRWQSGKSTVAEWAAQFFGLENAAKSISQTTAVAIQRSLSYYSCLPVCLDEYRNTKDIAYKNGFLRNVYNRQGAGKGVKDSDHGLRDAKVRGTLIIAGEETPKDGALLSRCIVIFVSRAKRQKNHFTWFQNNRLKFSGHFYKLLKEKPARIAQFFSALNQWKEYFTKQEIDDRTALNYATVVAGHEMIFGDDIDFADWLATETRAVQSEGQEEQAVSVFLDDLGVLKTRKLVNEEYWSVMGNKVYFYFHGLHQIWAQEFRKTRGEEAFKEGSIRAYLKEESGFIEMNVPYRIKGQMKKCMLFELDKAPEALRHLVESSDGHVMV